MSPCSSRAIRAIGLKGCKGHQVNTEGAVAASRRALRRASLRDITSGWENRCTERRLCPNSAQQSSS
ncbi:hypothetical protein AV530_015001 [Patagioenas fasciata monilis]|uniref:Uncharacterized protein n=1 Tax=Patagioenas fasciata monilis TaxID=372326 RepID=A0A1V4K0R5_PATFA|nr:hypothetical protein AV530_015001 [Patagioenas fasciata monilis]